MAQHAQRGGIPRHAEVRVVPSQFSCKRSVLLFDWQVAVGPTPFGDALQGAAEAVLRGLLLHDPVALLRLSPEVRKPEQIEARRVTPAFARFATVGLLEADQSGFLRVQSQAVLPESLRKHVCDSTS